MAAAYILLNDGSSTIIAFDLTISETHEASCEATEHPVEAGMDIVDHVRVNPQTLNLEVYVTNTPTSPKVANEDRGTYQNVDIKLPVTEPSFDPTPGALFREALNLFRPDPPTQITVNALHFQDPFDRVKEIDEALETLRKKPQLVNVVASRTYANMLLVSKTVPRTTAGGAPFNLSFREIRTVTTKTVDAPVTQEKSGQPNQANGGQATKALSEKDAKKASEASTLYKIGSGLASFF